MKEILNNLEQNLKNIEAPVLRYFNPPIEREDILVSFVKTHYNIQTVPNDLIAIYKWHQGTNYKIATDGLIRLAYFAEELCLNDLSEVELILNNSSIYKFQENLLFPLCSSLNGEYLAIKLDGNNQLVYCSTSDYEIENMVTMFDNLVSFIKTINEMYARELFKLDELQIVRLDLQMYDEYLDIGQEMNPNSDYWKVKKSWNQ
jgi:hypothetical protein